MSDTTILLEPRGAVPAVGRPPGRGGSDAAAVVGPALVALGLSLLLAGRPSFWLDETATVSAVDRPLPALVRMLRNVDAVHGAYYVLLWPWARVSTDEAWLRLPSALAAAGGTAAVVGIGWQVFGRRTAVLSGLLFATLPLTSYNGANARSAAFHIGLVAAGTFFLLRATASGRRRWWVAYSLTMAAAGTLFLFAALALVAHLLYVLVVRRPVHDLLAFVLPVVAAAVVAVPARRQTGQVSWIRRSTLTGLPGLVERSWFSADAVLALALGLLALGGLVVAVTRPAGARRGGAVLLAALLLAPTAVLWGVSQVHPLLDDRYVGAATIPVAILAGHAIAAVPRQRVAAPVLVGIVVLAGLTPQVHQRQVQGRGDGYRDDPRGVLETVAAQRRPGDAVSFPDGYTRGAAIAYPDLVAGLPDVSLATDRIPSNSLYGYGVAADRFPARLVGVRRVWLVTFPITYPVTQHQQRDALRLAGFTGGVTTSYGRTSLTLYTR